MRIHELGHLVLSVPGPGAVPAVLPRRARVDRDPRRGATAGPRGGVLLRTHPRAVADRGWLDGAADAPGAPGGAVPLRAEGRRQRRRLARGRASPDRARGADPGASDHTATTRSTSPTPTDQIELYVDVMATEEWLADPSLVFALIRPWVSDLRWTLERPGGSAGLRQGPGDDLLHDLGGAGVDLADPQVGPRARDRILLHVAVAAVELQARVSDLVSPFR